MADIKTFNSMYGLPVADFPGFEALKNQDPYLRLTQLKKTLQDEVDEIDEIITFADQSGKLPDGTRMPNEEQIAKILELVGDLMTDLQVYAQSEMVKWGLPIDESMDLVMASNASKMGADGKPIIKEGKLIKGPNYWSPNPALNKLYSQRRAAALAPKEAPAEPQETPPDVLAG